jgi:lysyl-tRNA synthetase class II
LKEENECEKEVEQEDPRLYHEKRLKMVSDFETNVVNPFYPHKFHSNINIGEIINKYNYLGLKEEKKEDILAVGARVMFFRSLGKMIFFDV